jgi:hypothetical protein
VRDVPISVGFCQVPRDAKQIFDNAEKTHRAALAAKTCAQTSSANYTIPTTINPTDGLEAVKAAAVQHKRGNTTTTHHCERIDR